MDLIIKNLEKLQDYHTKEGKHPIERLVLDFDKLSEMEGFTKIFEKSCEKYNEPKIKSIEACKTCKHWTKNLDEEPCYSCYLNDEDHYEPAEPVKSCGSCKYQAPGIIEPCGSCITMGKDNYYPYYEPAESEEDCRYSIKNDSGKKECSKFGTLCLSVSCTSKEPSLKEVTERMQSEFDATGIDTKNIYER